MTRSSRPRTRVSVGWVMGRFGQNRRSPIMPVHAAPPGPARLGRHLARCSLTAAMLLVRLRPYLTVWGVPQDMKPLIRATIALAFAASALPALAADDTPVGKWKTIDDKTHEVKSIVEITENGGLLEGKVLQVLKSEHGPHPVCSECDGERKNKPIEGMTIMWGLKKDDGEWSGGQISDPARAKTSKARWSLAAAARRLTSQVKR